MKRSALICLLAGIALSAFAQPSNDNYASAIDVTGLINTCSSDAAYTTVAATSDLNASTCWNTGGSPVSNVWFKFTAPASGMINVTVDIGGSKGTQQRSQLALWLANGTTEVACNRYVNNNDDVSLGATILTPGNTYYISVDVQSGGYRGTFTLCLSNTPDYDYYAGAVDVTSLIGSCSADAAYTTLGGTADRNAGSCWNTGGAPNHNRWFKFTAPATGMINVLVDIGGSKGTQQRTEVALWQANGTTEIACNLYVNNSDDVSIAATGLTTGNTYYISVDVQSGGYRGTFSLCLTNTPDYDYYEGAIDVTSIIGSCSADATYTTLGGTSDRNAGSCWNTPGGTPNYNRWFKFTAPASGLINATVDIGGSKGTQQRTELAIWQSNGTTEVACNLYVNNGDDVTVAATGLTPGNTYYISVDAQSGGYRGTFSLCLANVPDYDYYEGAIDVTSLIGSCSADAAYTTLGGTSDRFAGACWNTPGGTPNYNRWFKFTAPALGMINVTVEIGGSKGTQQRTELALWQSDGTTEVACNRYVNNGDNVSIAATGLTPGNTYYISVDAQSGGYRGTFSLCLDNTPDYDYYEGAIDVTSIIGSCSADAAYTTIGGTSDRNAGSCWNTPGGTPNFNRWFKFTAPASGLINATVDIGGSKGTQQRTEVAIWQSNGTTEVACNLYVNNGDDVTVAATGLTPGNTYYISVDAQSGGYRGTFSLCLANVPDYDYYEGAIDVTSTIGSCSADAAYTTIGGTSDRFAGTCWNTAGGTPSYNRWFKFTAPALGMINVTVDIGGSKGSQQRTELALWQSDGTTEVACNRYVNNGDNVSIAATTLTPGNIYYISVDAQQGGYRGTFTLCLESTPDYDYYEGAYSITDINNWCSSDAQFSTIGGTGDKNAGSCWNTGGTPNFNRWFKFTASATGIIEVTVDIGGSKGTQQRTELALWQSDGTTQVGCNLYVNNGDDVVLGATGLTSGATYYISVDAQQGGYRGSFTLCVTDNVGYDYYEGALELTDLNNWCSSDAIYTTIGSTSDKNAGSCWNTGGTPNFNRWFKFTAITANATIIVDIGGLKGTQQRTQLALWQSNGTTQVACSRYVNNGDDVSLSTAALVPGNTYYISVDAQSGGYRGTFSLCINNVGAVYYSRASTAWNLASTWSTIGYGGAAAASFPNGGDVANIQGYAIAVSAAQTVAEINITAATANTSLTVDNAALTVNGKVTLTNTASAFTGNIILQNNGSAFINNNLSISRQGGSQPAGVSIAGGTSLTVNKDLALTSTAGTGGDNLFVLNGSGTATVNQDVLFNSSGGQRLVIQCNNTSVFTVKRDISFISSAANLERIELNNSARLRIGRNFVRGGTPYGTMVSNSTSTVEYNGSAFLQNMARSAGSGGDSFTYQNVVINNTRITTPQVTLEGAVTVNGNLTMTSGVVKTTSSNILNLKNASTTTIGSTASYVDGPMTYEVAASGATSKNFPIGKGSDYRPMVLNVNHSNATSVVYTVEHFNVSAASLGYTLPAGVERVSGLRYWHVDRQSVANLNNATVRLYYGNGTTDGVTDYTNLTVVKNVGAGTAWVNVGGTASGNGSGNILSGSFASFCDITLANLNGGSNPLPIELKSFHGEVQDFGVLLTWTTSSESGSDYFEVQRSDNAEEFESVSKIHAAGSSLEEKVYHYFDAVPVLGRSYYRLKMVDLDGTWDLSDIIVIDENHPVNTRLRIVPYPNPSPGALLNIHLMTPEKTMPVLITVYNSVGDEIYSEVIPVDAFTTNRELDLRGAVVSGPLMIVARQGAASDFRRVIIIGH